MQSALSFSRGSAGLYALLAAIAKQSGPGDVIIPTLCCESVALAALYAGHSVSFADVSPHTLCVTPETVASLMSRHTRAVILVHLFGIDADANSFHFLRSEYSNSVFIEDVAQALGGYDSNGQLLGHSLDFTLLSFADDKIIPGDGGVLLFGSDTLQPETVSGELPLDVKRESQPRLARSLRNSVHAIADSWREKSGKREPTTFVESAEGYTDLIIAPGGISDEKAVAQGLDELEHNRKCRYKNYLRYQDGISLPGVLLPSFHENSTCWRCPVVFESHSQALRATRALRAADIPASNHYFPLSVLFDAPACTIGENIALRIVNLWSEGKTPYTSIERSIEIVNQL